VVKRTSEQDASGLETHSKELFEQSIEHLDAHTRSRLTRARHAALDELKRARSAPTRWLWAPAGGLAAIAAVAIFVFGRSGLDSAAPGAPPLEELDAVAAAENIELLQDVEFYAWLAEQSQPAADANSG
jgi:hypothetical protein